MRLSHAADELVARFRRGGTGRSAPFDPGIVSGVRAVSDPGRAPGFSVLRRFPRAAAENFLGHIGHYARLDIGVVEPLREKDIGTVYETWQVVFIVCSFIVHIVNQTIAMINKLSDI